MNPKNSPNSIAYRPIGAIGYKQEKIVEGATVSNSINYLQKYGFRPSCHRAIFRYLYAYSWIILFGFVEPKYECHEKQR